MIKNVFLSLLFALSVSPVLADASSASAETLSSGSSLTLFDFPYFVKKGMNLSMSANVGTFDAVLIGKGYNQYRGRWLRIDTKDVIMQNYESSVVSGAHIAHGLSIQGSLNISLRCGDNGKMDVVLQSKDGEFVTTIDWGYEANYDVFVRSDGSTLKNVKLNATNNDFQKPVWAFGDSYFGVTDNRVIGQLKNLGFFNMLVDGIAGASSAMAYADLLRAFNFGTPQYLVWCLGMNDSDDNFKKYFDLVKQKCQELGITLIGCTIPTVPERNKEIITQYVKSHATRYIDAYTAVGSDPNGNWNSGYLSTDNVHPTQKGARAIATQWLSDFPELMMNDGETVTIGGNAVGKTASVITFDGDNLTLTYSDDSQQTAPMEQVNISFSPVAAFSDANGFDNLQSIKTFGEQTVGVSVTRPMLKDQWALLCLPFDMNATTISTVFGAGSKVAQLSSVSDGCANFTTCTEMTAGIPYIIYPTADVQSFALNQVVLRNIGDGATVSGDGFDLKGTLQTVSPQSKVDYLANGNNLKALTTGGSIKPLHGYFTATATTSSHLTSFTVDGEMIDSMKMLLGDVNADQKVDITDVMMTVNSTVGQNPQGFDASAADLNGDGHVTVSDVIIIVNIMLSPSSDESSSSGNGSDIATNSTILWETNQEEVQP